MTRRGAAAPRTDLAADPVFRAAQFILLLRIVVVVAVFDPRGFDTFTLNKSAVAHIFSAVLAALLVWLFLRRGRAILVWSPVHIAVAALVVLFAVATFFALDRNVALFGAWRRYLGLTQMVDHAVLYVAAVVLIRSTKDVVRLAAVGGAAALIVVAYAVVQRLGLDPVHYEGTGVVSTLGHPDIVGGFLSIAAVSAFSIVLLRWRQLSMPMRAGLLVLAGGSGMVLLSTGIRNGVLGVAGGLVAAGALIAVRRGDRRAPLLALLATTVVVAVAIILSPIGARLTPAALAADGSVHSRLELWGAAGDLIAARPLLGYGPDNFAAGYPAVRDDRAVGMNGPDQLQTSTHGWEFYFATSAGYPGLIAFSVAVVLALLAAVGLARRSEPAALAAVPLAAYLGQGLVDINDIAVDWILWVTLGVLAGAGSAAAVRPRGAPRTARALTMSLWPGAVAVTAVFIIAVVAQAPRIVASRALNLSEALIAAGNQAAAFSYATTAANTDGRRPEYWSSLGTALTAVNPGAAASAYQAAADRAPWHPLYWRNLAVVSRAAGDRSGALVAARRATAADPADPEAHRLLSSLLFENGQLEEAAREGERSVQLLPTELGYETPILAYIRLERWDAAVRLAQRAVAATNAIHLHLRLAQAYAGAGQSAQAAAELAIVLAAQPADREALDLRDYLAGK